VFECAVADVEADLTASPDRADLARALDWLLSAARPLLAAPTTDRP